MELAHTQQVRYETETAKDLGGLSGELQQTWAQVESQHVEIAGMEKFSDEMLERVLDLTDVFHQIDQRGKTGKNELEIGEKAWVRSYRWIL